MNLRHTYRHIVWDWNGTLLDDAWLCIDITNGLLAPRNLPLLTPERYQETFDFPVRLYYERLGFDLVAETFEELGSEFIRVYDRRRFECTLQPQARETLRVLRDAGFTQSVLSAYHHDSLLEIIEHHGLTDTFTDVVGIADHYAGGKIPQGRRWMADRRLAARDVLLAGDTTHDHEVAAALGAGCVLVPSGHHPRTRLATCGVPVLDSLPHVASWLRTPC